MTRPFEVGGRLLAKNTFLSILTQVLPMLVAVATTPYVVHRLGASRYGVLTLSAVMLGYLSLVDFGVGRAAIKLMAERLGQGVAERAHKILWTALTATLMLGFVGCMLVITSTPFLVNRVFHVDAALQTEARDVFYIISATSIIILLRTAAEGLLEALQRFDLISLLRTPSLLLSSLLPVGILWAGGDLPMIVLAIGLKDACVLLITLFICKQLHHRAPPLVPFDLTVLPDLFGFGKWMTLHNIGGVLAHFMEPVLIASLLTLNEVTYYSVPYDAICKLTILPSSLMMVLFPAFSSLSVGDQTKVEALFWRGLKHLVVGIGWLAVLLGVFSREILVLWLGTEFARSATVLQVLAIGWVLAAVSWHFSTLLQGTGHIKEATAVSLLTVVLQVPLSVVLIRAGGIEGAAFAFTLVRLATVVLFYQAARRMKLLGAIPLKLGGLRRLGWLAATILATTLLIKTSVRTVWPSMIFGALFLTGGYAWLAWRYCLTRDDKNFLWHVMKRV